MLLASLLQPSARAAVGTFTAWLEHTLLGTVPPVDGRGQLETLLGLSGRFSAEGVVLVAEAGQVLKNRRKDQRRASHSDKYSNA